MSFKTGQFIVLSDPDNFIKEHLTNIYIKSAIDDEPIKITCMNLRGDVEQFVNCDGDVFDELISVHELEKYFQLVDKDETLGKLTVLLTHVDNSTTLEEGVTKIDITKDTVSYQSEHNKNRFLTYKVVASLKIDTLQSIIISTNGNERVFDIENGVVVREHVMYVNSTRHEFSWDIRDIKIGKSII